MDIRYPFFLFSKMRKKKRVPPRPLRETASILSSFCRRLLRLRARHQCGQGQSSCRGDKKAGVASQPLHSDRPRPGDKRSPNASAFCGLSAAFQAAQTLMADKLVTAAIQSLRRAAEGPWRPRPGATRPQKNKKAGSAGQPLHLARPRPTDKRSKAQTRLTGAQTQSRLLFKMSKCERPICQHSPID